MAGRFSESDAAVKYRSEPIKTIDRWEFGNVTNIRARLEAEEAARRRKEEEEARYWAERRKQALAYWDRLRDKQELEKLYLNAQVIFRGNVDDALRVGVISTVASDGTYAVKFHDGSAKQGIARKNLIFAPPADEVLYVGARVGVQFPNTPGLFMGIIAARNEDGSYGVRYDGGSFHFSIARSAITLFHNEPIFEGDKVEVTLPDGTRKAGSVLQVKGNLYTVKLEDGTVLKDVARDALSLDHSQPLQEGQRVAVRFPNNPTPFYGVIKRVHPDFTYSVKYDGGHSQESIARHMITPIDDEEPLYVGDRVLVTFPNGKDYRGKVTAVNDDNTYSILYDSGKSHKAIVRSMIQKLPEIDAVIAKGDDVILQDPRSKPEPATVTAIHGNVYVVTRRDGSNASVPLEFLSPAPKFAVKRQPPTVTEKFERVKLEPAPEFKPSERSGMAGEDQDSGSADREPTQPGKLRMPDYSGSSSGQGGDRPPPGRVNIPNYGSGNGHHDGADKRQPGRVGIPDYSGSGGGSGNGNKDGRQPGRVNIPDYQSSSLDERQDKKDAPGQLQIPSFAGGDHAKPPGGAPPGKLGMPNFNGNSQASSRSDRDPPGKVNIPDYSVPSNPQMKTIDRWEWNNVKQMVQRFKDKEQEEKRLSEEEKRFWEEKRRRALENWARWLARQEELKLRDKIVYGATPDGKLSKGVVTGINNDGSYNIILENGEQQNNVPFEHLLIAPIENSRIDPGARVGVITTVSEQLTMGTVMSVLPDGSYVVKFDSGDRGEGIQRRFITLFYNDALAIGDRVGVLNSKGEMEFSGVVHTLDKELELYGIKRDDNGSIEPSVARSRLIPVPQQVQLILGDQVSVRTDNGKVQGEVQKGVILAVNPDNSYIVDVAGAVQPIVRRNIVGYNSAAGFVKVPEPRVVGEEQGPEGGISVQLGQSAQSQVSSGKVVPASDSKGNIENLSATVRFMSKGGEFVQYFEDHTEKIFLFYLRPEDGGEGSCGSLHWCKISNPQVRPKEPGKSISLRDISDVYMGKKPGLFPEKLRKEAKGKGKMCFSIIVKDRSSPGGSRICHFEAANTEVRTMWINGINTIITGTGKQLQVAYQHEFRESEQTRQRFPTLRPAVTLVDAKPRNFGGGGKDNLARMRMATLSTYSAHDILEMMEGGDHFVAYSDVEPLKQDIFLFLVRDRGPGKIGILYWCDPHAKVKVASKENSLPMAHISGVHLGKQTGVFKQPCAQTAVWNRCFSLLSYDGMRDLHLEAHMPQQVSAWLEGINTILS